MPRLVRASYKLDRELRVIGATPSTLDFWGKALTDIVGRKITEIFPYLEGSGSYEAMQEALRTYRPVRTKTFSVILGGPIDLEIYPTRDGLQVIFGPTL